MRRCDAQRRECDHSGRARFVVVVEMSKGQASGRLFENRIVIWDIETSRRLFRDGYYGKPLGIPKPKDFEFNAPLILDLMEAYYLAKKKVLRVESEEGERLGAEEMEKICVRSYTDFPEKYLVYRHLREAGYVVTPGIKFGSASRRPNASPSSARKCSDSAGVLMPALLTKFALSALRSVCFRVLTVHPCLPAVKLRHW